MRNFQYNFEFEGSKVQKEYKIEERFDVEEVKQDLQVLEMKENDDK